MNNSMNSFYWDQHLQIILFTYGSSLICLDLHFISVVVWNILKY